MNRIITGMILGFAISLVIPLQGYAATPKETVEAIPAKGIFQN